MSYAKWFDVAVMARKDSARFGFQYADGVERLAALAAVKAHDSGTDDYGIRDAMTKAFEGRRLMFGLDPCDEWPVRKISA